MTDQQIIKLQQRIEDLEAALKTEEGVAALYLSQRNQAQDALYAFIAKMPDFSSAKSHSTSGTPSQDGQGGGHFSH